MKATQELTLIILKPDLKDRQLTEVLLAKLKANGLAIVFEGLVQFNIELIKLFYQWSNIDYAKELWQYLCSREMTFMVLRGENAIQKAFEIRQAMRLEYCTGSPIFNMLHASDSKQAFQREFALIASQQSQLGNKKMDEVKTDNQVEVILFKKDGQGNIKYLMLKRSAAKGGFWQPITGNVKPHENHEEAALRETKEETGITNGLRLIDTGFSFEFDDDNRHQNEQVFGLEISEETQVELSAEHTEFAWVSFEEAVSHYLKYPGNITGLTKLNEKLGAHNG